jgi:hypothetical protein
MPESTATNAVSYTTPVGTIRCSHMSGLFAGVSAVATMKSAEQIA